MSEESLEKKREENYTNILNGIFDLIIIKSEDYINSEKRETADFSNYVYNLCDLLEKTINKRKVIVGKFVKNSQELPF